MPKVGKKTYPYTKSGVAAAKKAASKPSMKKVSAKVKSSDKDVRVYSWDASNSLSGSKLGLKAGQDARGRASKYGKPVGSTAVYSPDYYDSKAKSKDVRAVTTVKSARGNLYDVSETKNQIKGKPDTNRSTDIYSTRGNPKKPKTSRRDPKFGPAPKVKKKK